MTARKGVIAVFLFRNMSCIIDETRPLGGDYEYHISTVTGTSIGWFTDVQVTEQESAHIPSRVIVGYRYENGKEVALYVEDHLAYQLLLTQIEREKWFLFRGERCALARIGLSIEGLTLFLLKNKEGRIIEETNQWTLKIYAPQLFWKNNYTIPILAKKLGIDAWQMQDIVWYDENEYTCI